MTEQLVKELPLFISTMLGPVHIKEIAIPCANNAGNELQSTLKDLGATPFGKTPGLYQLNELNELIEGERESNSIIRLLPIEKLYVVLQVKDIGIASSILSSRDIKFERIGGRPNYSSNSLAKTEEEIHLSFLDLHDDNSLPGASPSTAKVQARKIDFCIRLTESDSVKSFFNEESASITRGTIQEIQSERVFGGDGSIKESKFGFAGDCWSEAHAILRTKMKGMLSGKGPIVTKHTGPRVSKMPSIME